MIILPTRHNSLETAYLQDYPYGRGRCVRAIWVENYGYRRQRFAYATTHKAFNSLYNGLIESDGPDAAFEWAVDEVASGRVRWNKTKASTYGSQSLLVQRPERGDEFYEHEQLPKYPWTEKIEKFRDEFLEFMDDEQKSLFLLIERSVTQ